MSDNFNQSKEEYNDSWLTPKYLLKALGKFDLDPCSPVKRPWDTAKKHYTIIDDGLIQEWGKLRVFCNPPYSAVGKWMAKMAFHNNGIALTFARVETKMFFDSIWNKADSILFLKGRLSFYNVDGTKGGTVGAPSCLIAYGYENSKILSECDLKGHFIALKKQSWSLNPDKEVLEQLKLEF